jgi:hypothetical protein
MGEGLGPHPRLYETPALPWGRAGVNQKQKPRLPPEAP